MLHTIFAAAWVIEAELAMGSICGEGEHAVLRCGNTHCRLFCSCDFDLDPMTSIYELDPYCPLKIYQMCKCELPTSSLWKVIV